MVQELSPDAPDANESEILNVLDDAIDARLIEPLPKQPGHYQFSHALIQQTLTDAQSTATRAQLHARIANVLESHYGDETNSHAGEILLHLGEAGSLVPADRIVHYALAAGTNALNAYSTEEAQSAFELGLASLDDESSEIAAKLWSGLGQGPGFEPPAP